MRKVICIILVLSSTIGNAQTFSIETEKKIDSLNTILRNTNNDDTLLAQAYVGLSEILIVSSFDTMYYLSNKAKEIAEKGLENPKNEKIKISLMKSLAAAYGNIGYVYNYRGNRDKAFVFCQKSLELSKKTGDKNGMSSMYNNLGLMYSNQGNAKKALEYYYQCLKIRIEIDDTKGLATIYNNIGAEYRKQQNYDKTLEFYKKSLSYSKQIKNERNIARNYSNIGFVYFTLNEVDTASYYWEQSLKIREKIGDEFGKAESYTNLASIKELNNELDDALDYLMRALKIYDELSVKTVTMTTTLKKISGIYYKKNKIKIALAYGNKGLDFAQTNGFLDGIMLNAENLYLINKSIGNNKTALIMHELYIEARDSIQNDKNKEEVIKNEFKYEYEKQHLTDSIAFVKEHEVADLAFQVKLEKEKKQKYLLYVGIIFLIAIGGIFLQGYQRKKKDNEIISAQKEEMEKQKSIVDEKNKEITDSITYAKRIQEAILPQNKLVKKWLPNSFIFYKPKDIVAGDFYWMDVIDDYVLFAAADCTGHGVPGAMVSVVCHNALNRVVREFNLNEPGGILDRTREIVIEQLNSSEEKNNYIDSIRDGMDIALCVLNTKTNQLKYAGANNPLWILRKHEESMEEIKATKQAIGSVDNPNPYLTHTINLKKGDSIYVFSDGYADQFGGPKGKKFKYKPLKELLVSMKNETMENQLVKIDEHFEIWKGNLEQVDDVCLMGVKI